MKTIRYSVPQAFIDQRESRKEQYNPRGRSDKQHRMDIDAELYEYYYLNHMGYTDDDRWEIDMISPENHRIDCKNISKWYNISQMKMCYLLRQHETTTHFEFWEWTDRPTRPLEVGDMPQMRKLVRVPYWDVMKNIQPSKFNGGYYVDIRKHFV